MYKNINKFFNAYQKYFSGELTVKKFMPGIAWFFILLALLCLPGSNIPPVNDWMHKIYFDKWVHIGLFGLLATLFMAPVFGSQLPLRKKWIIIFLISSSIICWGYITEEIQHNFIEGRSFDPGDWLADSFGTVLAIFFTKKTLNRADKGELTLY